MAVFCRASRRRQAALCSAGSHGQPFSSSSPSNPVEGTRRFPRPLRRRASSPTAPTDEPGRGMPAGSCTPSRVARRAPSAGRHGDWSEVSSGSGRRCLPPAGPGVCFEERKHEDSLTPVEKNIIKTLYLVHHFAFELPEAPVTNRRRKNHTMLGVGRDLERSSSPTPLTRAESPIPGYTGTHSDNESSAMLRKRLMRSLEFTLGSSKDSHRPSVSFCLYLTPVA
ncbi:uncharacterized protein [Melanerpes formicivorus]|uniref:uncharacterized protein n=1 Tax=Melanerpes formicivorus TaxID=211600 RepID=UPI00358E7EA0